MALRRPTEQSSMIQNLSPPEVWALLGEKREAVISLDVRTVEEFTEGHIEGSLNIPLYLLDASGNRSLNEAFAPACERHLAKDQPLVVSCAHAHRSVIACEILSKCGFTELVNMEGGFLGRRDASDGSVVQGWIEEGLPLSQNAEATQHWANLRT